MRGWGPLIPVQRGQGCGGSLVSTHSGPSMAGMEDLWFCHLAWCPWPWHPISCCVGPGLGTQGINGLWPRLPAVFKPVMGSLHTLPPFLQAAQMGSGRAWRSPCHQHRHPWICVLPPAASQCSLHSHSVTGSRPCSPGAGVGAVAKPLCCAADSCGKSGCSRMNPAGAAVSW